MPRIRHNTDEIFDGQHAVIAGFAPVLNTGNATVRNELMSRSFTVGIVTYERPRVLQRTLDSLATQSRPVDELVIVDDSENDTTERLITNFRGRFTDTGTEFIYIHRSDSPDDGTGMTDARNRVLDVASGDIICYIDDDVICPEGWLRAYESAYEEFPDAAAIGGPGFDVAHPDDDIDVLETVDNQNRLNKYGECLFNEIHWDPPVPVRTHHIRGVNMSFPKSILEDMGGFNPVYKGPAFFEETDVMARIWKRGDKLIYHPGVALYHLGVGEDDVKKLQNLQDPYVWYWSARNGLVFRYHVFPETFWIGLLRILLYMDGWPGPLLKEVGAYVFTRDRRRLQAMKGYLDGLRQIAGGD